jgi:hypothetical protein
MVNGRDSEGPEAEAWRRRQGRIFLTVVGVLLALLAGVIVLAISVGRD